MDLNSISEYIKCGLNGLCPILGTVNFQRRTTDTGDSSAVFKSILIRTVASAAVAIILGCAAGLLSAYVTIQTMQERLNNIDKQLLYVDKRVDNLENRSNKHFDRYNE